VVVRRVGLLGFGTVGSAVARRLALDPAPSTPLQLTHIFDRRAALKRETCPLPAVRWTNQVDDLLTSDVDIVVEAIGGIDEALAWTRAALQAGKSVVSCNKQLIAHHGPELLDLAARQGRQLRFEGAVGGAMPIIGALGDGLAGERVTRIVAILNGTTNAVLSRMEARGETIEQALAEARALGYAEADASADLDGLDARAKLAILCAIAFGLRVNPDAIEARTTARIGSADVAAARRRGEAFRQLAYAGYDEDASRLTAWVAPRPVKKDSLFGRTTGPQNAAIITGVFAGDIALAGAGAGGDATAVAVLGDLLAVARGRSAAVPARPLERPKSISGLDSESAQACCPAADLMAEVV
jgi:homoserine dehydrogenase